MKLREGFSFAAAAAAAARVVWIIGDEVIDTAFGAPFVEVLFGF